MDNRCHFELNITDNSGTLTATVSETLAEKILCMIAEQIYETVAIKKESLPIAHISRQLAHKIFNIQLQKPTFRMPNQKIGTLVVSSCTETDEGNKKQKMTPFAPTKKQ
ncbi:hypothetical protein HAX54_002719 [Datura stramonium]|uniref:Uncharacterized protein n=1 Tax=Datura stramonium TaxID=4076 RepID=A0ABS8RTE6_DATST|nr:hypothetical protein [Datura stramonium]